MIWLQILFIKILDFNVCSDWQPTKNEARNVFGDASFEQLSIETRLSLSKGVMPNAVRPLTVPIYNTSTYIFESIEQFQSPNYVLIISIFIRMKMTILQGGNYIYQRYSNPTQETAEVMIRELEHGAGTLVYNSGLASVNALLLCFLLSGDHIVLINTIHYVIVGFNFRSVNIHCIRRRMSSSTRRYDVSESRLHGSHYDEQRHFAEQVASAVKKTTKVKWDMFSKWVNPHRIQMIYLETPCNPTMTMVDIESICKIAAKSNVHVAVDATFASPYLLQPIRLGADFVLHSWWVND